MTEKEKEHISKMNKFKAFNIELLGDKIRWFDRVGYFELVNGNTAKLTLSNRDTKEKYVGYKVMILSDSASVDAKFFNWNDYFEPENSNREFYYMDGNQDIIRLNVEPRDKGKLKKEIFDYINIFNRRK